MLFSATLCYTIALAFVSLLPSGPQAPGGWDTFVPPNLQDFLHLPAYTVLTIFVLASADSRWTSRPVLRSLWKKGTGSEPAAQELGENSCCEVPVPLLQSSGQITLVCTCILFGILLEFVQAYVPGRTCSVTDMLTNAAGAAVGLIAWRCLAAKPAISGQRSADRTREQLPSDPQKPEIRGQKSEIRKTTTDHRRTDLRPPTPDLRPLTPDP